MVASVCLANDLALGQPLEHSLRRGMLAVWLGEELGLTSSELRDVYYVSLLGSVGCVIEAATMSDYVGDEIAVSEGLEGVNPTRSLQVGAYFLRQVGKTDPPFRRARKIIEFALQGKSHVDVCRDIATQVGQMIDLGPSVQEALGQCHEQWNGKGGPRHLKGEQLSLAARVFHVAHDVEVMNRAGGTAAAVEVVRDRARTQYDPVIAARFIEKAGEMLLRLDAGSTWDAALSVEPKPFRMLSRGNLDTVLSAIGDFVDVRSSFTIGHSNHVADLAQATAINLGLPDADAATLRHAGLVHDLGRAGVPVSLWQKREQVTPDEWERMKGHPSLSELIFAHSRSLGHLGVLAGLHHERMDGSGYRGVTASFLPVAAQVLAASDAYQTKLEPRPHRDAMSLDGAASEIKRQAGEGKFDSGVVNALLAAAGQPAAPRRAASAGGLSEREMEVLALVVRGLSNKEMARELVVSPKTVGHHVQHIYEKIGVSTRVGATLFAIQHGVI